MYVYTDVHIAMHGWATEHCLAISLKGTHTLCDRIFESLSKHFRFIQNISHVVRKSQEIKIQRIPVF